MSTMMIRRTYPVAMSELGPRQVRVRASTGTLGRDGMIVHPAGIDLAHYRKNPVMLWQHDPMAPVARAAALGMEGDDLVADVEFAPAGVSTKADEICGLVKSGVVNAVSIGFEPLEAEPLDPKKPRGGQRVLRAELMEISFVSVPADREAIVLQRADKKAPDWKVGAARDLPIEDSDAWDGDAAKASIFEHAANGSDGGDDFDPAKAKRGFLAYDAANPKEKGSYKDPIAHVVDGELKVPKGAIRAAASRLPTSDLPENVKEEAGRVLDHYKEKAGIGEDAKKNDARAAKSPRTRTAIRRSKRRARPGLVIRGMDGVGQLAWLMDCLADTKHCTEIESALEGDNSNVPAMLATALQNLGAALIAMTQEEVAELIGDTEVDPADDLDDLDEPDMVVVMQAPTPAVRALRAGYARARAAMTARAGAKHSAETMRSFRAAMDHHDEGMELARGAMRSFQRSAQVIGDMLDGQRLDGQGDGNKEIQNSSGKIAEDEGARAYSADFRQRQAQLLAIIGTA